MTTVNDPGNSLGVMETAGLRAYGVFKSFGDTQALSGASLCIAPGTVHGLLGHNGSGKSTMIKILCGLLRPDAGDISIDGHSASGWKSSHESQLSVGVVHQDLGLVTEMTGLENFGLQTEFCRPMFIDRRRMATAATASLKWLGAEVDLSIRVSQLSAIDRTMIALAGAVGSFQSRKLRYLILDEVTVSLGAAEVQQLSNVIDSLRASGIGILFVSHRLAEIETITDVVTVLREGRVVVNGRTAEFDETSLAELITGPQDGTSQTRHSEAENGHPPGTDKRLGETTSGPASPMESSAGACALDVRDLSGQTLRSLSFSVSPGEIVGVAGLDGSGRDELGSALVGVDGKYEGTISVGPLTTRSISPIKTKQLGITLSPGSRSSAGLIQQFSVRENLTLSSLASLTGWGWRIRRKEERRRAELWAERLSLRPRSVETSTAKLSGGTRQKVLVARCLQQEPQVLVIDEPTAGIDVGVVQEIWGLVKELATTGIGIVVIGSDLSELIKLSDRLIVLRDGQLFGSLQGDRLDEQAAYQLVAGSGGQVSSIS